MNKSVTIEWNDEDNRDSYKLCLEAYNIKCIKAVDVDPDTVEITVYGPKENVDRFRSDADEGCCEPLDSMSRAIEYDEDYQPWLNNKIYEYDCLAEAEVA